MIELLAPRARLTSSITTAALFRLVGAEQPTILMDEADTYFRPGDQTHEELRGMVNAGHRKGAEAYRCVGQNQDVRAFPAYAAVALAGIGDLPDTVLDRAVLVRMRRRAPDEPVEPLRRRLAAPEASALQARLAKWVEAKSAELQEAWPAMPEGLTDRPADCWEPLLAIADVAGGDWPERGRKAAVKLNGERQQAEPSWGVHLLADIRTVMGDRDRRPTEMLLERLNTMEEAPWGDFRGKPLDARGLARRLKPFGIESKTIRMPDGSTPKGYLRTDFVDAWRRYLPSSAESATSATSATPSSERVADAEECGGSYPPPECDPPKEFEFDLADVADVADFPEETPNGRVARLEGVQDGDWTLWRLVGPKPSPGLFRTREHAEAWAAEHGWGVAS